MIPYRLFHVTVYTLQNGMLTFSYRTTYDCRQHAESLAAVIADCAGTLVTVESED